MTRTALAALIRDVTGPEVVATTEVSSVFASTDLTGCAVALDGDNLTISSIEAARAARSQIRRAAEVALAELRA